MLRKWFGPVADAIKGKVNAKELVRAVITGVATGGGAMAILEALKDSSALWVDPSYAAIVTASLTVVIEIVRRWKHGSEQN